MLLDLTAAFNTVDHVVLISCLENFVGIKGTGLRWFESYLTDRSFSVHLDDYLHVGVPQVSVLGLSFSPYICCT